MRAIRKKLMQSRWGKLIPLAGALALMTANASAQAVHVTTSYVSPSISSSATWP